MAEPLKYTRELFESICETVGEGHKLQIACERHGVERRTFYRWMRNESLQHDWEWMRRTYQEAVELRAEFLFEEILDIADDSRFDWGENKEGQPVLNSEHVQRSKIRCDKRQWIVSKMNQNLYGDKVQTQLVGSKEHDPIEQKITVEFVKPKITEEDG